MGVAARYTYPLALPVSVLHFISGLEMDRTAFLGQWQAITVPEVRDTFAVQPQPSSSSNKDPPPGAPVHFNQDAEGGQKRTIVLFSDYRPAPCPAADGRPSGRDSTRRTRCG